MLSTLFGIVNHRRLPFFLFRNSNSVAGTIMCAVQDNAANTISAAIVINVNCYQYYKHYYYY